MPLTLSGTNGVSGVDGTVSSPANRGSDTNTGIFYGTDTVSVATNGTTAVTVDSSQNVGIGTASTNGYGAGFVTLQSNGSSGGLVQASYGTTTAIAEILTTSGEGRFGTRTNHPMTLKTNNTEAARIDTSGNLLVGTTTTGGGKVCVKNTPSSQWGIDFNECEISIANNSNAAIPTGSGMVIINDPTQTGALGVYLFGGSTVVKVSSTDGTFVNPTTTPNAGTASIQTSGGTYRIYNNIGQTITFKVAMLRTRNMN